MRNVLIFLLYVIITFAILVGFTSVVWLPLFFLPTKAGFVIGAFITAAAIAITKLLTE